MNALVATRKRLRHVFERKKRCTRAWWRRSFDWRKNKYPSELFQHCFASKRWGHWQNYFCMQGIHVSCCLLLWQLSKKIKICGASTNRAYWINSYKDKDGLPLDVRAAILPVYNDLWKWENLSKYLDSRTHKTEMKFLTAWHGLAYQRPIMWVLTPWGWVFMMLLPILSIVQLHL